MSENQQCTKSKQKKRKQKKKKADGGTCLGNEKTGSPKKQCDAVNKPVEPCKPKPLNAAPEEPAKTSTQSNSSPPVADRKAAGSNWQAQLSAKTVSKETTCEEGKVVAPSLSKSARQRQKRKALRENQYVAMDCEMVGVGFNGQEDMLARVSIVSKNGEVLLDKFVKAREPVTDYRTSVSGIRPHDMENGEDFDAVQDEVVKLLQGKVLVGHAIRNDLAVLHIKHPYNNVRDTARYKPLCRLVANGRTPSLKRLTQAILGLEIQTGEHNSVEDARAAMNIYNRLSKDWEAYLKGNHHRKV